MMDFAQFSKVASSILVSFIFLLFNIQKHLGEKKNPKKYLPRRSCVKTQRKSNSFEGM